MDLWIAEGTQVGIFLKIILELLLKTGVAISFIFVSKQEN